MKKLRMAISAIIIAALSFTICINAFAADTLVGKHDAGTSKTFTVTDAGVYRFFLYGSKGADYGEHTGGNGGVVFFAATLNKGDTVQVVAGNQSGVGGGGIGKASNGGGASYIKVNGTIVGVAGGGGGATENQDGLPGGATNSGNNGLELSGDDNEIAGSAGGGAGYVSGTSGRYHVHTGSETAGGGCYGQAYKHTHSAYGGSCYTPEYCGAKLVQSNSNNQNKWMCKNYTDGKADYHWFGTSYPSSAINGRCGKIVGYNLTCTTSTTTTFYKMNCGLTEADTPAYGGSNYIASSVSALYNVGAEWNGLGEVHVQKTAHINYNLNKPASASADPEIVHDSANDYLLYATIGSVLDYYPYATLFGYTFDGWYTQPEGGELAGYGEEEQTVTWTVPNQNEITLYAHWTPQIVKVELSYNGPSVDNKIIDIGYDKAANLETPSWAGYEFGGWYTEPEGGIKLDKTKAIGEYLTDDSYDEEGNNFLRVFAHWNIPSYTISFNANGGSTPSPSSKVVKNLSAVGDLPISSRDGYTFLGWYTSTADDAQAITKSTIARFDGNTTLYAHWQLKTGYEFPYTGGAQYFTAPTDGYYKLEAWGAQGGNYSNYTGGLGGYTKGIVWLKAGQKIQVNVGGQGSAFNGGGTGTISTGGGGTDFRLEDFTASGRIFVAGGGGGASTGQNGGAGGATDSGNNGVLIYGSDSSGRCTAGGGGGYYGGTFGHIHTASGDVQYSYGGCFTQSERYSYTVQGSACMGKHIHGATVLGPNVKYTSHHCCLCCCHKGRHKKTVSGTRYRRDCGVGDGDRLAYGGSNYIENTINGVQIILPENKAGIQSGNGFARITQMYVMLLDTSAPTIDNNYEVKASNLAFLDVEDTILDENNLPFSKPNFTELNSKQTGVDGQSAFGLMLVEKGQRYDTYEKLPVPSLKGWKFVGWYTEPQINKGQLKTDSSLVEIKDSNTVLKNPVLYAHWQEETYYIKYYKANTTKNIYNDTITNQEAKFDTTLTGAYKTTNNKYRYNATEDCYIQTVKYDHNIKVLPNYYAKTGYYFKNWTNKADTDLAGAAGIGTGTGKQTGKTYYESEVLKQHKTGDQFLATFGNFNYITNEKEMALDSTIQPIWSYGSDTVVMYATWEPIKYQLKFNGTNNWNTAQGSYLQNVVDSTGKQSTTIRYDQIFTLNPNKFTRNAPFTIKSPEGLDITLKTGYSHIGWGFGKPTMKYSTPAWNLVAMNTEYDPDQALLDLVGVTGRDYINQQASVKNVISVDGIKAIEKYISDWSNARTDSNRADKQSLEDNVIESNLHSLWRRNAKGDDPIDPDKPPVTPPGDGPDPDDPDDDNFGITITFDLNGGEWLDTKTNKPTTDPIVLKQELFNEYYYEFDIIGNTNTDLLNKSVIFDAYGKKSNTDPSKNYDNATGLNYTFKKSDEQGNKYRFCGWSLEKGQISADYNATIDGITKYNFDTYDAAKNSNTIKVANDLTLYAIWEPELTLNVHLYRILGESADTSGSLTKANQNTIKAEGLPKVTIKPGEEGRYLITLNALTQGTVPVTNDGESVYLYRPIDINVEFDSAITGIYNSTVNSAIQDRLNIITASDGTEPTLATTNLNRKMVGVKSSSLSRNFHVPLYLGTTTAANYGYPSFKAEGYDLNITASRYSNFHKGIETVTAEFIIETTKSSSGGGEEPDPGPGPEPGPGPGPTPGPIDPTPPTNTLDELRTKLKIKLH